MNRYFSSLKYNLFQLIKVCFVVCPLIGQAQQQKQLQEADYPRWGTLKSEQISEKGNWVSYRMAYSGDIDTLFIKHINSNKKYFFTNAFHEKFLNEEIVALKKKTLYFYLIVLQELSQEFLLSKNTILSPISRCLLR
jgi:hypothetical protein